ncbi:gamma-glutamylcyclotransferase family protein [Nitrosophilus alvini]|uniref:gamma-glutamylcyclotransferase family protein n=1 Tax=Nitrosophilus alvini TaxID=2714855 RepID=UPI00190E06B9|nr:gamma-glutamylcyclotransferase family protein [Nitrosophilus alvini]
MQKSEYIFVYGTLKSEYKNYYAKKLRSFAKFVTKGSIKGKIVQISWYPGLLPSVYQKDKVVGEIYKIEKAKKLLKLLDKYEEASKYNIRKYEYRRVKARVLGFNGKVYSSWVYFYNKPL